MEVLVLGGGFLGDLQLHRVNVRQFRFGVPAGRAAVQVARGFGVADGIFVDHACLNGVIHEGLEGAQFLDDGRGGGAVGAEALALVVVHQGGGEGHEGRAFEVGHQVLPDDLLHPIVTVGVFLAVPGAVVAGVG